MDPNGRFLHGLKRNKISAEDRARLDGNVRARVEQLEKLAAKLERELASTRKITKGPR